MQIRPDLKADYQQYLAANSLEADPSGYSNCVVQYAEKWAGLMEVEIARRELIPGGDPQEWTLGELNAYQRGVKQCIKEVAEETSRVADRDPVAHGGITGFMYGCAVSALARFWVYGDYLRAWHNRLYLSEEKAANVDASGGVVNPAIVTLEAGTNSPP